MKDILKRIIVDFIERELPGIKERELDLPADTGKIISIVGARRTGKTYLLYRLIKKLRQDTARDRIIYINFEDDRLFPATVQTMDIFLTAYYELYPDNKSQTVYFFFDEIQVIENWELFIRRLYDNENCAVFITGSSSKLLIREVSTALRGRSISYELFPLSFREYLTFKGIEVQSYSSTALSRIAHAFAEYSSDTAFPELVNMDEHLRRKSLNEYLDLIIYKDIVERYRVANIYLMKYLIKFLFSNCANLISINKIYNELKSLGLKISRNSVYEYISYLEDSYAIFGLPLYTRNLREQQRNPRKYYAPDIGLIKAMTISEDKGRLLETVVFLHLRRQYENVFYYFSDREVDFVVKNDKEFQLINVCYDMTAAETKKREITSLSNAMKDFELRTAYLLTGEVEGREIAGNRTINIMPVWKWLLS